MTVVNTFGFNGTGLFTQPAEHHWVPRQTLGFSGDGHQILPAVREYEMTFSFSSSSEFNQMVGFLNMLGNGTGTLVAALPEYGSFAYQFRNYSGCILQEIEFNNFFENYYEEVKLTISNIRT